eukprot:m.112334 g.112334  ORF g.112334 m.112334 type:complete len:118 (-) comp9395_c0_seq2:200-553(-)
MSLLARGEQEFSAVWLRLMALLGNLQEYAKMPASEQTFEGLHRAVSAALSSRKKFKSAAHLLRLTARAAKQLSRTDLKAAGSAPQSPSLPARAGHAVGPARASSTEQTNKSAACVLQ